MFEKYKYIFLGISLLLVGVLGGCSLNKSALEPNSEVNTETDVKININSNNYGVTSPTPEPSPSLSNSTDLDDITDELNSTDLNLDLEIQSE